MNKIDTFPGVIFVSVEHDSDDDFMVVHRNKQDALT